MERDNIKYYLLAHAITTNINKYGCLEWIYKNSKIEFLVDCCHVYKDKDSNNYSVMDNDFTDETYINLLHRFNK